MTRRHVDSLRDSDTAAFLLAAATAHYRSEQARLLLELHEASTAYARWKRVNPDWRTRPHGFTVRIRRSRGMLRRLEATYREVQARLQPDIAEQAPREGAGPGRPV